MNAQNLLENIIAVVKRSASDPAFRELALSNPRAAIQEVGGDLPEGAPIRFTDDAELVIPLPQNSGATGELSEGALEALSGGHINWTFLDVLGLGKNSK